MLWFALISAIPAKERTANIYWAEGLLAAVLYGRLGTNYHAWSRTFRRRYTVVCGQLPSVSVRSCPQFSTLRPPIHRARPTHSTDCCCVLGHRILCSGTPSQGTVGSRRIARHSSGDTTQTYSIYIYIYMFTHHHSDVWQQVGSLAGVAWCWKIVGALLIDDAPIIGAAHS